METLRAIGQHPQPGETEVPQDLAAGAEVATIHRDGPRTSPTRAREVGLVGVARRLPGWVEPVLQVLGHTLVLVDAFGTQVHDDAVSLSLDAPQRGGQVAVRRIRLVAEHVAEEITPMHSDQGRLVDAHGTP